MGKEERSSLRHGNRKCLGLKQPGALCRQVHRGRQEKEVWVARAGVYHLGCLNAEAPRHGTMVPFHFAKS